MMDPNSMPRDNDSSWTRRRLLTRSASSVAATALGSLIGKHASADAQSAASRSIAHWPARAKRVIYLFQSGAPSQLDLFDPKPLLVEKNGEPLPDHIRGGQRLTGMSAYQASIPLAGSVFDFKQYGQSGAWVSELMPHTAEIVDDLCFVKSMYTEAINHDPAATFFQTGSQIAGRPSFGSWLSYGLGSENQDLPSFVVMTTAGQGGQPLYARLWGSGFLDSRFQGVRFRAGAEPVLYLGDPPGVDRSSRRAMLETLFQIERRQHARERDPEIESRIAQYELAFRMQTSVPEVTDLKDEPDETFELYGEDARKPGTYAANCVLARRLAERGVRFIQLYHQGWDQHDNLPGAIRPQAMETDQASAALVKDLKRRGMLDDTLVIWGGEFGRTAYSQGRLSNGNYGRDHHPRCFTIWMAGGGVRAGTSYGQTDEYGYNIVNADGAPIAPTKHEKVDGAVHIHDLQATILRLLGIDHQRLTFPYQGRRFRLTDVHGHVIEDLMA